MKKSIKIRLLIFSLSLILSLFCINIYAESEGFSEKSVYEEGESSSEDAAYEEANAMEKAEEEREEAVIDSENTNIFETVYDFLLENSDKLFSALAFIGTLAVAFTYKRGLLPTLEKSLAALAAALAKIKEEFKSETADGEVFISRFEGAIASAENAAETLKNSLAALGEKLEYSKESRDACERFELIFVTELEMLYDALMSSSISQYQKDRMADSISKLKARTKNAEAEDTQN